MIPTLTKLLRQALAERACSETLRSIEAKTGVANPHLCNFLNGKAGLTLASVDKLLPYLGIEARQKARKRQKGGR